MDLHTNSMVIFHSFLYVYQRVMFPFKPPTKGISDFHRWSPEIQPFRAMPLGESYQPFIPRKYHQRVKILLIMFLQFLHKLLFFFSFINDWRMVDMDGYGWIWTDMVDHSPSILWNPPWFLQRQPTSNPPRPTQQPAPNAQHPGGALRSKRSLGLFVHGKMVVFSVVVPGFIDVDRCR